jgi:hypothetical protein
MKVFQDLRDDVVAFEGTPESVSQDLRMDLAELVARHLRDAGLTQTQFAEKFGKKAPYINRIIGGSQNCTLDLVGQIIFAMGLRAKLSAGPSDALPYAPIYFSKPSTPEGHKDGQENKNRELGYLESYRTGTRAKTSVGYVTRIASEG